MATAKQIAWRKKFAALSKAGKLPTAKKKRKQPARAVGLTYTDYSAMRDNGITMTDARERFGASTAGFEKRYRAAWSAEMKKALPKKPRLPLSAKMGRKIDLSRDENPVMKRKPAVFKIQVETSSGWKTISEASSFDKAKTFAQMIHKMSPTKRLRVDG